MHVNRKPNWKQVKDYPDYLVSDDAQVFSMMSKRNLTIQTDKLGYQRVELTDGGNRHSFGLHRLVATAFVENKLNKPEVNHIDGNKQNNFFSNLEWVTRSENMKHAIRTGLATHLRDVVERQKKKVIAYKNDTKFGEYDSLKEASKDTGVSIGYISFVINGKYQHAKHDWTFKEKVE